MGLGPVARWATTGDDVEVGAGVGAKVGAGLGVEVEIGVGAGLDPKVDVGVEIGAEVDAGAALGAVPPVPAPLVLAPPCRIRPEPAGPPECADPFTTGVGAFGRPNHRVRGDVSPEPVGLGASRPGAAAGRPADPRLPPVGAPGSADRRRAVGVESEPVGSRPAPAHRGRTTGRPAARCTGSGSPTPVLVARGR